jgi:hypothetical protein
MIDTPHSTDLMLHKMHAFYNDHSFVAGGVIGSFYSWFNGIEVLNFDHLIIDLNQLSTLAINTLVGASITTGAKFFFKYLHYLVTKKPKSNHE